MQDPNYLLAAFKQRIADSLHDYADLAEQGRTPGLVDGDSDQLRGVRFAAELVAGRAHNPHADTCACPCTKPDPALLPTPTVGDDDVTALAAVLTEAGSSRHDAALLAGAVLAAGYRQIPNDMPPGPAHRASTGQHILSVPGYPHHTGDGWVLRTPCSRCDRWHEHDASPARPGDRMRLPVRCHPGGRQARRQIVQPETVTVIVQAAHFNPAWERHRKVSRFYWRMYANTPDTPPSARTGVS